MRPMSLSFDVVEGMYAVGLSMLEGERWSDAQHVFRAMVLLFPTDERSWLGLGRAHEELEQDQLARELYSLCLLAVPGAVRARVRLARVLARIGQEEFVSELLDRARELAAETDDIDPLAIDERVLQ